MKSIVKIPQGELPDSRSHNITVSSGHVLRQPEESDVGRNDIKQIPGNLYGINLKKIKSYNLIRRNKKIHIQSLVFIQDLEAILKQFPIDEHDLNDELLVEVLSIAEAFFIYGSKEDRDKAKSTAILTLMKPYFRDDEKLLLRTVGFVWKNVTKTNCLRRSWSKVKFFF